MEPSSGCVLDCEFIYIFFSNVFFFLFLLLLLSPPLRPVSCPSPPLLSSCSHSTSCRCAAVSHIDQSGSLLPHFVIPSIPHLSTWHSSSKISFQNLRFSCRTSVLRAQPTVIFQRANTLTGQ